MSNEKRRVFQHSASFSPFCHEPLSLGVLSSRNFVALRCSERPRLEFNRADGALEREQSTGLHTHITVRFTPQNRGARDNHAGKIGRNRAERRRSIDVEGESVEQYYVDRAHSV
jgi:hypothetical protein